MDRKELKDASKNQLRGKWGTVGGIFLLMGVVSFLIGLIPRVGPILTFLIAGPIMLGIAHIALKVSHKEEVVVDDGVEGFKYFLQSLGLYFFQGLFIFLWSLLLIIPGIIKALSYSMAFYIMADNPEMSLFEALDESKRITDGYKLDLFVLQLSFIGWGILCTLTFGIGYFWLVPYMEVTYANTYHYLKAQH